jgi:LAO/AO transport system kinase
VVRVLDAVGFDAVLVETVGVGQSEIEIAGAADTTVVIVAPGMGDAVQAAKAGVLEIGDVLVVNKADRDGAVATARELKSMVALGDAAGWRPPVVASVATTGEGVDEVLAAIDRHWEWIASSGELAARRSRRAREEIEAIASARIRKRMEHSGVLDHLSEQVSTGALDPFTAAERLVAALG